MPPKNSTKNGEAVEGDGDKFRWTIENERKLLLLTQGRTLAGEDYERLVTVFPGTNLNGVKIRCSRLRVEQRKLFEELGWEAPQAVAVKAKRSKDEVNGGAAEKKAPAKKARKAALKKGAKEEAEDEIDGEEQDGDMKKEGGVKSEVYEDEA